VHVHQISPGQLELDQRNTHYLRDVLRLKVGAELELFDDVGQAASARIIEVTPRQIIVEIEQARTIQAASWQWSIASAVPKSSRADWMVEKLSEFGAASWIPLITARSVVHPESSNKTDRWQRIAEESARQCGRNTVMRIEPLEPLAQVVQRCSESSLQGFCLHPGGRAVSEALTGAAHQSHAMFFIGPEGGWTTEELELMRAAQIHPFALAATILRIETAAIAVAAIAQMHAM
jgi:16S rRNA (uracil1498-N3)-methyltransferase